ncbi:MAG TPA: hypothetical protein PLY87_17955 [Planctomycetaceae bacterium]|nr:hypothetical protein [Planctomycetaceae bacterium]HQZ66983.1 hypothetical protein [Planctomycetaceae bacterium]
MNMEVFELDSISDNPLFEGFGSGDNPSFLGRKRVFDDFFADDINSWDWKIEPLADKWKPIIVEGRTRSFNDYPSIGGMVPAFSRRAADALRDYLEPNGELLPLIHPAGEYYAFNCRRIVEILDRENTKALWGRLEPRMASSVDFYSIHADRLTGLTIFRLREMPNRVFVTTTFVERAREHGLNGFHFKKIWPFPEGVSYWMEDKKNKKAASQIRTAVGSVDIKAESLVICLPLADAKLTKDEKKRIAAFEDELDAQLFTPTLDSPYFGSLEGRKTAKSVTKLYLSCPNSDALFRKLSDWLKSVDWQPRPTVLIRNVPFDDFQAQGRIETV